MLRGWKMFCSSRVSRWRMDFVLLGLFSALVVFRNSSGLNYGELHIGLSERVPVTGLRVYCTTADGRLQAFSAREENPRYFSQILCTGAIQSLHISVPANVVLSAEDIEVRFGENWGRPSRRLQFNLAETRPVVADAGPRQVFEVIPQRVRQSWFARPGSCNWQGDFWLLIVPLVQSAVIVGIGLLLRRLWALNAASALPMMHTWGTRKFSFRSLGFVSWGFSAVRVFLLLLMSWQILTLAPGFLFVRWGDQFVAAVLMLCVLCGVLGLYVRFILTRSSDLQRLWVCAALVAIVFIVKLSFCLSFDGVQQGDYEKYYRYGMAIASGRWDLIGDSGVLTRGIFLERSAVFTAPLIWLFGPSLTGRCIHRLSSQRGLLVRRPPGFSGW